MALWLVAALLVIGATFASALWLWTGRAATRRTACVIVLGDIIRSPRIVRQAAELRDDEWDVTLIGYGGGLTDAPEQLSGIRVLPIPSAAEAGGKRKARFAARVKAAVYRAFALLWTLLALPSQKIFLVQNPPCIPTFAVVLLSMLVRHRSASLVIDWHNLAFTILGMNRAVPRAAVFAARWYERTLARFADAHLAVTGALSEFLQSDFGVSRVTVLPDRPTASFQRGLKLSPGTAAGLPISPRDAPMIVSSTSWTPDEDFSVLLAALPILDTLLASSNDGPERVLVLITGRGPLRAQFEEEVQMLSLVHVVVHTAWLSYADYIAALSSAAIGISMHVSSSGLDLPMKAVDMIGCGLPVLSPEFAAVRELIVDGRNGVVFDTAEQLAQLIAMLLRDWPNDPMLSVMRREAACWFGESHNPWKSVWIERAAPVFRALAHRPEDVSRG